MVKRNVELQLEAIQSYSFSSTWDNDADGDDEQLEAALEASMREIQAAGLPDPEEFQAQKDAEHHRTCSSDVVINDEKVNSTQRSQHSLSLLSLYIF